MNMAYEWQETYFAAVLETRDPELVQLIAQAENAIKARVMELAQDHYGTPEERRAMAEAMKGLEILRQERVEG